MGRGSSYAYKHFMLFDGNHDAFMVYPELYDVTGVATGEFDYRGEPQFDEMLYNTFLDNVAIAFKTERVTYPTRYVSREAHIFAETDRLEIGVDWSGGLPCIFVLPKTYVPWNSKEYDEKEYNINRDVQPSFSRLILEYNGKGKKLFNNPMFRFPTSSYTSSPYKQGKYSA